MKYSHAVKYNGVIYPAGMEVKKTKGDTKPDTKNQNIFGDIDTSENISPIDETADNPKSKK